MTSKACNRCAEVKPLELFHKHSNTRDGRQPRCKACALEMARLAYHAAPDKTKLYARRWAVANPEKTRDIRYRALLKRNYGLTLEQYRAKLAEQDGVCAICKAVEPGRKRHFFCVDHDHTTGKVRGILCQNCNDGLGRFSDTPETLRLAAKYLERYGR